MKVVLINKSDSTGGAAVVTYRLMEALRNAGIDARMLVTEKLTDSPYVETAASKKRTMIPFLTERLKIFMNNGFERSTLFKIDTASDGLPLHCHPLVKEADVVCLNWVNQGMLSLWEIERICKTGKPVVWTMHDMWNFTGICHHAGSCGKFRDICRNCMLLGKEAGRDDLSTKTMERKRRLYSLRGITFVAVSNWLAALARQSSLLSGMRTEVIPNAFPLPNDISVRKTAANGSETPGKPVTLVFGAARLDDPIKGLPILVEATRILKEKYPDEAERMELVTFGNVRNAAAFDGIALRHRHLGMINGADRIRDIYLHGDIVVSTSLYETLPGTLVEGQAYGCVPVSFSRGGQSDIITHRETGWLCDFNEKSLQASAGAIAEGIIWAAHAPEDTRRKMLSNVMSRFSAESVAKRYIDLFSSLLG